MGQIVLSVWRDMDNTANGAWQEETHPAYAKKEDVERNQLNQDSYGCHSR